MTVGELRALLADRPAGEDADKAIVAIRYRPRMGVLRKAVLDTIGDCLQSMIQCSHSLTSGSGLASAHTSAATLIELLEVADCGSVGGFDQGQGGGGTIFNRWDWLYRKYHNPEGERFGCDIVSYEDIRDAFQATSF